MAEAAAPADDEDDFVSPRDSWVPCESPERLYDPRTNLPPFPILTVNSRLEALRIFSWVGLRVAGMGETIKKDRMGTEKHTHGTLASELMPCKKLHNFDSPATPVQVVIVDGQRARHVWSLAEYEDAVALHALHGGNPLVPEQGGWIALVGMNHDKVVNDAKHFEVIGIAEAFQCTVSVEDVVLAKHCEHTCPLQRKMIDEEAPIVRRHLQEFSAFPEDE
jgi:hypothetical protein